MPTGGLQFLLSSHGKRYRSEDGHCTLCRKVVLMNINNTGYSPAQAPLLPVTNCVVTLDLAVTMNSFLPFSTFPLCCYSKVIRVC